MKKSIPMKQIIPKTSPNPCNLSINKTLTRGIAVKDIDLFITKRLHEDSCKIMRSVLSSMT